MKSILEGQVKSFENFCSVYFEKTEDENLLQIDENGYTKREAKEKF